MTEPRATHSVIQWKFVGAMRSTGIWIIVLSIISAVLPMLGMQLVLLSWVEKWGPTTGWIIRGGLVLLGGVLLMASGKKR